MARQPNIIFMVADNLGYEAVDFYGEPQYQMPRLNQMGAEGVVFDNCLIATPLCSLLDAVGTLGDTRIALASIVRPIPPIQTQASLSTKSPSPGSYETQVIPRVSLANGTSDTPKNSIPFTMVFTNFMAATLAMPTTTLTFITAT